MEPEEIYAAYGLTCRPRYATLRDPGRPTYGRAVARVSARLRTPMMPHQRYIADVALEANPDGSLRYRKVYILVPRQHGKTTLVLSVGVHRMTEFCHVAARLRPWHGTRQKSLYAAQKLIDSREKFVDDHWPVLDASTYASRYRKRQKNGAEALLWSTGGIQAITASGETSGHGKVLDLAFEDEAFAATDNRLEAAFTPAMSTRESPQHWVLSTEGTEKSTYLADIVEAGRQTVTDEDPDSTICYIEFSADPEADRRLVSTWLSAMPACCPTPGPCECTTAWGWRHTITQEHVSSELEAMTKKGKEQEFDRAYLNIRRRSTPPPDPNMPTLDQLRQCIEVRSRPGEAVAMAVDITPRRSHAAITVVGPVEDGWHAEVIDHRAGTDWVVGRMLELAERWSPLAWGLDIAGPAGSLMVPLEDAGIVKPAPALEPEAGQLWIPSTREIAAACGRLADAVRNRRLRILDDPTLLDAWAAARTRPLGDAWAWARRAADGDISPLCSMTVGLGAYEARKGVAGDVDVLASLGLEDDGERVEGDDEWI